MNRNAAFMESVEAGETAKPVTVLPSGAVVTCVTVHWTPLINTSLLEMNLSSGSPVKHPPAKPGAFGCEPLKAAMWGR